MGMSQQVFLGGASGTTTWRRDIAIPALDTAGVSYYNPQLPLGAWTEANEAAEMRAKDAAAVLLFVINHETRGVASVAEVAYYMGIGRQLALAVTNIPNEATLYNQPLQQSEIDDLNRGRIFIRTMARHHNVPVFPTIEEAVLHAIELAHPVLTIEALNRICKDIHFGAHAFRAEAIDDDFLIHIASPEFTGRKWYIHKKATRAEVVRTALKAALTWQEHEGRELFTYRGKRVHGPHFEV